MQPSQILGWERDTADTKDIHTHRLLVVNSATLMTWTYQWKLSSKPKSMNRFTLQRIGMGNDNLSWRKIRGKYLPIIVRIFSFSFMKEIPFASSLLQIPRKKKKILFMKTFAKSSVMFLSSLNISQKKLLLQWVSCHKNQEETHRNSLISLGDGGPAHKTYSNVSKLQGGWM